MQPTSEPRRKIIHPKPKATVTVAANPERDRRAAALRAHLTMAVQQQEKWAIRMTRAFNTTNKLRKKIKRLLKEIQKLEGQ